MTPISARSRSPTRVEVSILSISARLVGSQHGRLAALDHMLRATDSMRWLGRQHAPGDQPIEQHPDASQVLLDRRLLSKSWPSASM